MTNVEKYAQIKLYRAKPKSHC